MLHTVIAIEVDSLVVEMETTHSLFLAERRYSVVQKELFVQKKTGLFENEEVASWKEEEGKEMQWLAGRHNMRLKMWGEIVHRLHTYVACSF